MKIILTFFVFVFLVSCDIDPEPKLDPIQELITEYEMQTSENVRYAGIYFKSIDFVGAYTTHDRAKDLVIAAEQIKNENGWSNEELRAVFPEIAQNIWNLQESMDTIFVRYKAVYVVGDSTLTNIYQIDPDLTQIINKE